MCQLGSVFHASSEMSLLSQLLPPATKLRQGNVLYLSVILFTGGGEWHTALRAVHAGRYGQQAGGMHPT